MKRFTKIACFGDNHGRDVIGLSKTLLNDEGYDRIVMLGDFLDSRLGISEEEQLDNLERIIKLYKNNTDKIVLIVGNHDWQYIHTTEEYSPRFMDEDNVKRAKSLFYPLWVNNNFRLIHKEGDIIFSHAGVSQPWLTQSGFDIENGIEMYNNNLIDPSVIDFYRGDASYSGYDPLQSPIWIRPDWAFYNRGCGIESNAYECKLQFVGHTNCGSIMERDYVVFCDCLDTEYAKIIIDNESKQAQVTAVNRTTGDERAIICC